MQEELFNGGFPLFFKLKDEIIDTNIRDDDKQKREFKNLKVIDVHDILTERKKIPFLNILEGITEPKEDIIFNKINFLKKNSYKKK